MRTQIARDRSHRRGFTLVELLVVTAIILILIGLALGGIRAHVVNSRITATKTTIEKIHGLLDQRMDAFIKYYDKDQNLQNMNEFNQAMQEANQDAVLAKILAKKKLLRRFFPQNFTELSLSSGMTNSSAHTADTESAEVLYYILSQKGTVLGDAPIGQDSIEGLAVDDTDKDGLKEFVDGWGKPIRFYRWPTRLIKTNGTDVLETYWKKVNTAPINSDQLKVDQDDPLGKTSTLASFEDNYHTFSTYHVLLVISGGPDERLGLYEPNDTANYGRLAAPNATASDDIVDNISNLNIRAGGK